MYRLVIDGRQGARITANNTEYKRYGAAWRQGLRLASRLGRPVTICRVPRDKTTGKFETDIRFWEFIRRFDAFESTLE